MLMTLVITAWAVLTLVGWLPVAVTASSQVVISPLAAIKPLEKWDWLQTSYYGALQQQADGHKTIQGRASHAYRKTKCYC